MSPAGCHLPRRPSGRDGNAAAGQSGFSGGPCPQAGPRGWSAASHRASHGALARACPSYVASWAQSDGQATGGVRQGAAARIQRPGLDCRGSRLGGFGGAAIPRYSAVGSRVRCGARLGLCRDIVRPLAPGRTGGHGGNRTPVHGFAVRCVATPPRGLTRPLTKAPEGFVQGRRIRRPRHFETWGASHFEMMTPWRPCLPHQRRVRRLIRRARFSAMLRRSRKREMPARRPL